MPDRKFNIITLGCKVNQYESAYLQETLVRSGWRHVARGERPNVTIVNTCIVTHNAAQQSRQAIRKAIRENPEGRVAAIGCYVQVYPDDILQMEGIDLVADNSMKGHVPESIIEVVETGSRSVLLNNFGRHTPFEFLPIRCFPDRTRAFLKVQDGCRSFCTYCIVPFARGPLRSLAPDKVISMIMALSEEGYKEIVLTGINLGKYGVDLDNHTNLVRLLEVICKEDLPVRIRISSIEPKEIGPDLIDLVASARGVCRHLHIPLQSGDDRVLKKMNRNYTSSEFSRLIEEIHTKIPFAAIGIDVMSGFPGEDYEAHQNTYSLIKDLPVSYLHVFPFSPRPGTPAAYFDDRISPQTTKERAAHLRSLGREKRSQFYSSCLKKRFMMLVEGMYSEKDGLFIRGRSDNYIPTFVCTSQDLKGRLIPVRLERISGDKVIGTVA